MRFGFSLLLATAVSGVVFAQTAAHATPLPARPGIESTVTPATFFKDRKREKPHTARKHGHPHKHAYLKKKPRKKH